MNNKEFYDSKEYLNKINKYWDAANYLSACQLYLLDNPLLDRPLIKTDIKNKIVGHWGTVPGQNFIYAHLNRIINKYDLDMIYISGPGHGGNFFVSNAYMEGTYTETYPNISEDKEGLKKLFKQFSFPGGISSHVSPECPGSIHEGGELGYSLAHAFGAVMDNKNLICVCVVGDGEAETGSIATGWHGNKFLNPKNDGVVLPILHLNGYKISNPTVLSRMTDKELNSYFSGLGYEVYFVSGNKPEKMHQLMADALDKCILKIENIKNSKDDKIIYPMIILRSPKGWGGLKEVNGKQIEGSFRAHQVPLTISTDKDIRMLEKWLKSYHPEELFDNKGRLIKELKDLAPKGDKRISASPYANGGKLLKEIKTPKVENYLIDSKHGNIDSSDMTNLGYYIRDIYKLNPDNFRIFGPDEALSNRLAAVFDDQRRAWNHNLIINDEFMAKEGRVLDGFLSENMCEGWLEGYLLTGRHGIFHTYEAFARVVDSMVAQHSKWLKVTTSLPWRKDLSSLNIVLASHVWQQDHNGYTHQDPGFIDHMVNKKSEIVRVYLPCDSNTLLLTTDSCLKTKNKINIIVASKHIRPQWLTKEEAKEELEKGLLIFDFASSKKEPDLIMACAGETPTLETLAAVKILNKELPDLRIRVVNILDLMKLQQDSLHSNGLTDKEYNKYFTTNKPIIFAYHGYPSLIRQLTYYRENKNLSVHGYNEEGTITTPFDVRVMNELDRYHLVIDAVNHLDIKDREKKTIIKKMNDKLQYHHDYIRKYGIGEEEVEKFRW